jgi:hypothetical protein
MLCFKRTTSLFQKIVKIKKRATLNVQMTIKIKKKAMLNVQMTIKIKKRAMLNVQITIKIKKRAMLNVQMAMKIKNCVKEIRVIRTIRFNSCKMALKQYFQLLIRIKLVHLIMQNF